MATIGTFIIGGIIQWAKLFEHNKDMGFENAFADFDGAYTIELVIDEENLEKYEASGSAGKPSPAYWDESNQVFTKNRSNKDGEKTKKTDFYIVKFKRKHNDPVAAELGGQPRLVNLPEGVDVIGNGSEVEVKFTVYTTKMSNGTRLEAVKINNLVEFEKSGSSNDDGPVDDDLPF